MSKICRTCLQKTNRTFKTSQSLGNFGEGSVRISIVLRFCIPELYLGLSSNPEICFSCKENLKVSYLFKKKCLDTENRIGNFLKNARCTGKSVELHDVLANINDDLKPQSVAQEVPPSNLIVVQNSEGQNPIQFSPVNDDNPQVVDVQQSVPNSTNQKVFLNYSNLQNTIIDQFDKLMNTGLQTVNKGCDSPKTPTIETPPPNKNVQDENDSSLFKISNVYSLTGSPQDALNNDLNIMNLGSEQNVTEDIVEIKDEPLDMDLNDNLNYIPTDEETLDASETGSYQNRCSPSLQEFIDSIPEVNHPDQYVDVPDFVTINNFGFKELEELRQQQANEQTNSKCDKEIPEITSNCDQTDKKDTNTDGTKSEMKIVKVLSNAPDVIIFNGKRMVKCGNQYRLEEEMLATVDRGKHMAALGVEVKNLSTTSRKRNRKKIKIVPVGDQPIEKKIKLDSNSVISTKLPKTESKDVVVLFTNYTNDGDYINDHDYLISPYKRNKILLEEDSHWLCMCFICNTKHEICEHVKHMKTHKAHCSVCYSDFGTPYMLNIHCKSHKKPCRYCTEVLPYGLLKLHEEKHMAEEEEIVEDSKRKVYSVKRGRKKLPKDEKPVYFAIAKQETDSQESNGSQKETTPLKTVIAENKDQVDVVHTNSSTKKRGRPRRKTEEDDVSETVKCYRNLRARVKRLYVESDDEEESIKESSSSSKGIDLVHPKEDEK